jgi:integrase
MNNNPKRIRVGDRVTIYPRGKNKTYVADYWQNGKHCRRSLETRNFKVARQRAVQLDVQLANGGVTSPTSSKALDESVAAFLSHLGTEGRRPRTVKKYRGFLAMFTQFAADRDVRRPSQVAALHIDQFRALRKQGHSSPKTMHNDGVMLKSFFRWCKQRKLIAESPMAEMTFHKPISEPKGGPSLAEIDKILAAANEPRRTQLALLAFAGLRSGELQRLERLDVDLAGGWIHVVSRPDAETKTGRSRKAPIHPRLRTFLEAVPKKPRTWFFEAQPSKKYPAGGHGINTKHLNEDFLAVLEKLALPTGRFGGYTIHSLRHSFETICVNGGIPQRVIDTWMGHWGDRSMASVYYKLADEESQKFMKMVPFGAGKPAADAGDMEVGR